MVNRLNILESENIVSKKVSPENKSKFVYSLTKKGIDLLPIVIEIMDWGAKYNENCPRRELGQKIQMDKSKVISDYLKKLTEELG